MTNDRETTIGAESGDSMANFLDGRNWSYFCTITTRYTLSYRSARRLMSRLSRAYGEQYGGEFLLVWFAEPFELKDGCHIHYLLELQNIDTTDERVRDSVKQSAIAMAGGKRDKSTGLWSRETWSRVDIRHYGAHQRAFKGERSVARRAGSYVTKYVNKEARKRSHEYWDIEIGERYSSEPV